MPHRSKWSAQARLHAHAAGFYVALLHEGEPELAHDFATWWQQRTGQRPAGEEGPLIDYISEDYSLDELGIDQEDREWP